MPINRNFGDLLPKLCYRNGKHPTDEWYGNFLQFVQVTCGSRNRMTVRICRSRSEDRRMTENVADHDQSVKGW